jgi:hypothetical protein
MRTPAILAAAAATLILTSGAADAARWCHAGVNARGCAFDTRTQCARAARRVGGSCHRQATYGVAADPDRIPGQIYPNRPYWAAPGECFTDDGGGRFRPCNAGDGGGRS